MTKAQSASHCPLSFSSKRTPKVLRLRLHRAMTMTTLGDLDITSVLLLAQGQRFHHAGNLRLVGHKRLGKVIASSHLLKASIRHMRPSVISSPLPICEASASHGLRLALTLSTPSDRSRSSRSLPTLEKPASSRKELA